MNTIPPYEKLMAAKLDQVPVPDMSDSVWASIEMQLDAGVDTPDKASDKIPSQGFQGKGWYGFLGVVVVVVTLWWYTDHLRHASRNTTPEVKPSVIKGAPPAMDSNKNINSIKKKNIRPVPGNSKKDTLLLHDIPVNGAGPDSTIKQELPPAGLDTSLLHNGKTPIPAPDSVRSKPSGKKPRGVKGITSDDYKITVEKGSDKRKQ